jgi:hypothetical protein
MAEVRHIQVDKTDPESGYLYLAPVVAEIVKIVKEGQGYNLVALRDFTGKEIVALIRGRERPGRNDVGNMAVFALSGQTKGDKVNYSGFYNPKEEIPPEYRGKRPPQPEGKTTGSERKGSGGSSGNNRSYALSYAKDLACAGAITIQQLPGTAIKFNTYLDTGSFGVQQAPPKAKPQPQRQRPTQEEDREIPETSGTFGANEGAGFDEQYPAGGGEPAGSEFTEGSLDDVPF